MQTPVRGLVYSRSTESLPQAAIMQTTASWVAAPMMQAPAQIYRPTQVPPHSYLQPSVQVIQTRPAPQVQQTSYGIPFNQGPVYSVYQPQQLPMNLQRPSFVFQVQDQAQNTGWSMKLPGNQQRPSVVSQGAVQSSSMLLKPSVETSFSTDIPASPTQSAATSPNTPGSANLVPSLPALAELALEPDNESVTGLDALEGNLESPEASHVELPNVKEETIPDTTTGSVESVGNLPLKTTDDQKEPHKETKSEQPLEGCFGFLQRLSKLCSKTRPSQATLKF